jgi:hypothetical protein
MKPIADDIISYEHEAPLQYIGIDNVREVRKERGSWLVQHEHHSFTHTS